MSNKKETEKVIRTPEEFIEPKVEPKIEEKPVKPLSGLVVNCKKLNVRKSPDLKADVLTVIDAKAKVVIDESKSTEDWYKVRVKGIDGFCMKKYITVK